MPIPEDTEPARVAWRISTRSANGSGNCVEAGPVEDGSRRVAVRHSRHPGGRIITYSRADWDAFIARVKDGDFDCRASRRFLRP